MKSHVVAFAAAILVGAAQNAAAVNVALPEVWVTAGLRIDHPAPGWEDVRRDAGDMWNPDAPWTTVAGKVRVIGFVLPNLERVTDRDLKRALADLRRRHIALEVSLGLIVRSNSCRSKTEAYVDPGVLERLFSKVRRNGGDVRYVDMDEPYFWGHRFSGPSACHQSAHAIAQAVAPSVHLVRHYFPQAQIGDSEVLDRSRSWVDELMTWADAYQQATGERLAFMDADLSWKMAAVENLVPLSKGLASRGIPLGIIYDAAAKGAEPWFDPASIPSSDVNWVQNALHHSEEVESTLGIRPDHAVFATWVHYPTRMLPEAQPGTFTNLIYRYIRQHETRAGRLPGF